jgi:hypothetical protein
MRKMTPSKGRAEPNTTQKGMSDAVSLRDWCLRFSIKDPARPPEGGRALRGLILRRPVLYGNSRRERPGRPGESEVEKDAGGDNWNSRSFFDDEENCCT